MCTCALCVCIYDVCVCGVRMCVCVCAFGLCAACVCVRACVYCSIGVYVPVVIENISISIVYTDANTLVVFCFFFLIL